MTHPAIQHLRELEEKATKGPWKIARTLDPMSHWHWVVSPKNLPGQQDLDIAFVKESRNALPTLLDCLEMALYLLNYTQNKADCLDLRKALNEKLDALKPKEGE